LGYDAFTPGEIDLSWGIDAIKGLQKEAKFPFLLANLLEKRTQKPVFQPYLIKEMGGIKIGLFGLLSNRFPLAGPPGDKEKYLVRDPIETATKIVAELREKNCVILIALAHMEEFEQKKLAETFPQIHLIVSGHIRNIRREPLEVNDNQIMTAGSRGEYLGQMDFFVKVDKQEKRLFSHFQIVPLDESLRDNMKTAELVNQYKANLKTALFADGKTLAPENITQTPSQTYAYPISDYMGDQFCLPCHQPQHERWKKTGHAQAYQTLVREKRSSDPTCLPCHTTGFWEVSAYGDVLENVQCESCHGPRKGHPENGQKFPPLSEKQCLVCHNPAKSPNFDYAPYLSKVRCPPSKPAFQTEVLPGQIREGKNP